MEQRQPSWQQAPNPWMAMARTMMAWTEVAPAMRDRVDGLMAYSREFWNAYLASTAIFTGVEWARLPGRPPVQSYQAYSKLLGMNADMMARALQKTSKSMGATAQAGLEEALEAWLNTWLGGEGETIDVFAAKRAAAHRALVDDLPAAIEAVEPEYGFHFERGLNPLVAETDRFLLYRIVPTDPSVKVDEGSKPLIIIPPYVLGSNILAFLPGENRSYAHAFANQGVPTYIRIMKPILENEAVQVMTGEDDALDTRHFCETVAKAHDRMVTLNGYCQGGFSSLSNILSGELDGLVDALISCVSPMDGTRSTGLAGFLSTLPAEFNDLAYGTRVLPNGVAVADGNLMGWVYKLKSIESENPISAYYRDLAMVQKKGLAGFSKSAAAINYWLANERSHLPMAITKMSFASYLTPITKDGTLPVTLFGKKLNLHRIAEKNIPWLICYGARDDLVEKEVALAPAEHVDVEVTEFPRGHVAIATSWSDPASAFGLHKVFEDGSRGPVRYQLDLDAETRPTPKATTVPARPATRKTPAKRSSATTATPMAPAATKSAPKPKKTTAPKKKASKAKSATSSKSTAPARRRAKKKP